MIEPEQGKSARRSEPLPHGDCLDGVTFADACDVHWRVIERDARHDPGARGDWCLIFTCADAVRRVWDYPADWRELPVAALIALSWTK